MKEKLEQQIKVLEEAQKDAILYDKYELIVGYSETIIKFTTELEIYK